MRFRDPFLRQSLEARHVDVAGYDAGTLTGKCNRRGATDAGTRGGAKGDLSG